jgi:SAM-dependent methyltransferase
VIARPAWLRLAARSYRIGGRRLARALRGRDRAGLRAALYRVLVPLEPWRVYELPRVARAGFAGRCLDVSSPKLLASTLRAEGRGDWTAVDLLPEEVALWRLLDPALDLRVEDARALGFPDGSFDNVACVSVIEHVHGAGDAAAMAEMWRVLRPGGVLHLTTNVAAEDREVRTPSAVYATEGPGGAGGPDGGGDGGEGAFFERHYSAESLRGRLLGLPWEVEESEYVRERLPVHGLFFAARPLSFLAGGLLPLVCAANFARLPGPGAIPPGRHGVAYLRLRKPLDGPDPPAGAPARASASPRQYDPRVRSRHIQRGTGR